MLKTCTRVESIGKTALVWGRTTIVGVLLLFTAMLGSINAQSTTDIRVKAAFVYNFAKFIEWPGFTNSASNTPIKIAIVGEDPIKSELESVVRGKSIDAHPIEILKFQSLTEIQPCHLLFISNSERANLPQILKLIRNTVVVTVSDMPDFLDQGGQIAFLSQENKIRFEVNIAETERVGVKLSSNLLKLALAVRAGVKH